ncbi:MAG: pyridoxamine 5'-phosphate oxidase [Cytophagales bacterium]|nr:pyridoxamine 5'-phosphate oxidase [Bernardetiaceae bacterium]MDW8210858.1 pyridoxamine 5'-phosphate oxidase [Cytophagales bacterium]
MQIADLRKEYTFGQLSEDQVAASPFEQFKKWLQEAIDSQLPEPTAMHLATVNNQGRPAGRIVLLKHIDTGFVFFTNYQSRKADELNANPLAALTFYWVELERQVRIEGKVEKTEPHLSDEYFNSRPLLSRLGAIASPQSRPLPDRKVLEERIQELQVAYSEKDPPRPAYWGGYRLIPDYFEFWQGRLSRLHDRIVYQLIAPEEWKIYRLAP